AGGGVVGDPGPFAALFEGESGLLEGGPDLAVGLELDEADEGGGGGEDGFAVNLEQGDADVGARGDFGELGVAVGGETAEEHAGERGLGDLGHELVELGVDELGMTEGVNGLHAGE